jgi:hypothetical protein
MMPGQMQGTAAAATLNEVLAMPGSKSDGSADGAELGEPARDDNKSDYTTLFGIGLLYLGIAVSMAMLFWPAATEAFASLLLAKFGLQSSAMHIGVHLPPAATVAQLLWVGGSVMLCAEPLRRRHWAFMVFEVSMVLASLLPLLDIGNTSAILLRLAFALQVMLWLGSIEGMGICRAMLPWYWYRVWRGELGETALAVVGSEILSWGYSLFAINAGLGWICLVFGAVVMMRFGDLCMRRGIKIPPAWRYVNYVYITTGIIQLLWVLMG